jgi:predicted RNase H-like HicB family nuclease
VVIPNEEQFRVAGIAYDKLDVSRRHIIMVSERYIKIVEWSDTDGAFVGYCPGVIGRCCHGLDEVEVYRQVCEIVEEWIVIAHQDGIPLPPTQGAYRV